MALRDKINVINHLV